MRLTMDSKKAVQRYRQWYKRLLRLYPTPYYERFGEGMEQTFHDLLQERARENKTLFEYIIWMCIETSMWIIQEHIHYISMQKNIIRVALVTLTLLLIPVFGNMYVDGWKWSPFDFVWAGTLIFSVGLAFDRVRTSSQTIVYKLACGLGLFTAFALIWINGAVGIIGEGDLDSANGLYVLEVLFGAIATCIVRAKPRSMPIVLFAMATIQMIIPVSALIINPADVIAHDVVRVFILSGFFATLFVGSGLLFRQAATKIN